MSIIATTLGGEDSIRHTTTTITGGGDGTRHATIRGTDTHITDRTMCTTDPHRCRVIDPLTDPHAIS